MSGRWVSADAWLRSIEASEPPRRSLGFDVQPRQQPRPCRPSPVWKRWPQPPTGPRPWPTLLSRVDQVVIKVRRQPKRKLAGRRAALLEDAGLAREVYELVRECGVQDALDHLGISRQALMDVWIAHGWPAPLGSGNKRARRTP